MRGERHYAAAATLRRHSAKSTIRKSAECMINTTTSLSLCQALTTTANAGPVSLLRRPAEEIGRIIE